MIRYLSGRLLSAVPVLLVVSILAFGLQALAPGDPARLLLEASGLSPVPPEALAAKRAELHLNDPLPVRYFDWLGHAVQGDFGRSFRSYRPVTSLYLERMPATALLAGVAAALSALVALPLGALAAYHRGKLLDGLAQVVAVLGTAVPGFWIALVLIFFFAAKLRWLPAFGTPTPKGIIMPAVVLALHNIAVLTRLTRAAMLDVLTQEFVTVARAKGLGTLAIARGHVLPNVLVPILTVLGLELAGLMTGAAVVEYVFAWPGVGKMAVDAALLRDTPIIVGFAVVAGLIFVLVNLVVDLSAAALDPRARRI
ncbi:MAG: ABC transporter permease [Dehalococcoidia bacterium]